MKLKKLKLKKETVTSLSDYEQLRLKGGSGGCWQRWAVIAANSHRSPEVCMLALAGTDGHSWCHCATDDDGGYGDDDYGSGDYGSGENYWPATETLATCWTCPP